MTSSGRLIVAAAAALQLVDLGGRFTLFVKRPPRSFPAQTVAALPGQWQEAIRNLRHPDAKVRLAALQQLGNAGYTPAAEFVAPLVTDPENSVQFAAIDAELTFFLSESIGPRGVLSFGGSRSRAQEAFEAGPLVRIAAPAPLVVLDHLAAAIRDENPRIRFDAIHAIGVIAEAPLPLAQAKALLDGLDHFDPIMRAATARVLGRLRVVEAGAALIAALNDSNDVVRVCATEALGLIHEPRALQALSERFAYYKKGAIAEATLLALARIPHLSSRDLFRERLNDGNPVFRRAAAEGLGRLNDRDSLPALKTLMTSDRIESVRLAAAFAVGLMEASQAHVLAAALGSPEAGAQARDYLLELGPAALPGLQAALAAATAPQLRADIIHVIGFVGPQSSAALIEPFTKDKDERVSRAAMNAIARLSR